MNTATKAILLGVVIGILALFARGLGNNPRHIPSPLTGRPAMPFEAPSLKDPQKMVSLRAHEGRWVVLNFWGSWCASCVREHPYLITLSRIAQAKDFAMVGVDFRDTREGGRRFLQRHGDTGYAHAFDPDQRIAIDWGVYGAPETFVIDPKGIVRLKHAGPLYPGWFEQRMAPLMSVSQSQAAGVTQ
ncbi:MAG: DsbE family thiol:disulfide interchange protein [Magnetococcales bacterium]|nr:DsbE family thiol:disulfide interchange protein [Magnetococcales bacterium]